MLSFLWDPLSVMDHVADVELILHRSGTKDTIVQALLHKKSSRPQKHALLTIGSALKETSWSSSLPAMVA